MTGLIDLPKEIRAMCCPDSHKKMLSLALDPEAYAHRELTLIDLPTPTSFQRYFRLTTLTMASPPDGPRARKRKLSKMCPPSVEKINLIRASGKVIDALPEACTELSVTRPDKAINVGSISGLCRVTKLHLDTCKLNEESLTCILASCLMLETLQLPNNQPGMLRGLGEAMRQGCAMPHLRSFDASFTAFASGVSGYNCVGSVVEAFPRLEELKLNVSVVPYELLELTRLMRLCIHLNGSLTAAKVAPMLQMLPVLERLEVIVDREADVGDAKSLLHTVAPSVKVQSRQEARHLESLSMLNAKNLRNLLDSLSTLP
jgi:hypothetical protein